MEKAIPVCGFKDSYGKFHDKEADAMAANIVHTLHRKFDKVNYTFNTINKFNTSDMLEVIKWVSQDSEALYFLTKIREKYLEELSSDSPKENVKL